MTLNLSALLFASNLEGLREELNQCILILFSLQPFLLEAEDVDLELVSPVLNFQSKDKSLLHCFFDVWILTLHL